MSRFRLSIIPALALSALGVSSALAAAPKGAQKAPIYGPSPELTCQGGAAPTPKTFGFVVLNTPGNETTVSGKVVLRHAPPNATYKLVVVGSSSDGGTCGPISEGILRLTTNKKGNGTLHFNGVKREEPVMVRFTVQLFTESEQFASSSVELD
ncbi:MAG TPA: hypothetical protein VGX51_04405 [Solirubrobacteraceae bacterium]|jgi:hypothetical protein|nr:hypothetical protein [Solirubrobacteraceae bacterium]